jgi:hypothetical protein
MARLFDTIKQLVAEEKYIVGEHASERLDERGIMEHANSRQSNQANPARSD